MAAVTWWPSLWVTISVNRSATRRYLERSAGTLRTLTAVASLGGVLMSVLSFYG